MREHNIPLLPLGRGDSCTPRECEKNTNQKKTHKTQQPLPVTKCSEPNETYTVFLCSDLFTVSENETNNHTNNVFLLVFRTTHTQVDSFSSKFNKMQRRKYDLWTSTVCCCCCCVFVSGPIHHSLLFFFCSCSVAVHVLLRIKKNKCEFCVDMNNTIKKIQTQSSTKYREQ